ncbi:hypothetical protein A3D77_01840 [Candidatus Gottesmanbacteria bacterium RIFCSPHIGHO2_02_FULL_39_11]|uniref:Pyrroline-5-carboxylate reductase catalytic N-terminal domain-containing protein n=1 Tax=Candidatus Gottesmanbacteria bacterium RIFCSPHIGHO2_02_FULL_39_11 TaxID=1798382 RepID=A0A1F5ZTD7_9BACT|nr:MAG: hypothetical protein A3D77_01840 [Candidatus Gottesmanbacteria bacterium RIFCSPHIGHO2_02_FULL_39_11]
MARGIGTRLITTGTDITFYDRNLDKAKSLQQELQRGTTSNVRIESKRLGESLKGKIVILALPYEIARNLARQYTEQLKNKILVDITNPIDFKNFTLLTPRGSSAAEEIAKIVSRSTKVVKSFNTTFAGTLVEGNVAGKQIDVFIAGDDQGAKGVISRLVQDSGMRPLDVGPLENSRALEGMQLIHMALQDKLGTNWMSGIKILP